MASADSHAAMSPPYAPKTWGLGLPATQIPDVPIDSVFLLLFLVLGITSMSIFLHNRNNGRFYVFNAVVFGMCLTRVIANSMRIASVYQPHNVRLAIATQVFVAAGIVALFVTNNFFAQRIFRALHPRIGWTKAMKIYPIAVAFLVIAHIVIVIVAVVQQFFTLDQTIRTNDRIVFLYCEFFFLAMAFLPIPVVLIALALPKKEPVENFGVGSIRTKVILVLLSSTLLAIGAGFRAGTSAMPPVPFTQPRPWYFSKACFYIFDFSIDWLSAAILVLPRMDKIFFVHVEAKFIKTYNLEAARLWREKTDTPAGPASGPAVNGTHAARDEEEITPVGEKDIVFNKDKGVLVAGETTEKQTDSE